MLRSLSEWIKPGLGIKRWVLFGTLGITLLIMGLVEMLRNRMFSTIYLIYFGFLAISGIFILYLSISEGMKNFVSLIEDGMILVNKESREIYSYLIEKKMQVNGPRLVALGGGTGLSTMLRGLKHYTSNLTAVVTVGDDGGGSGTLRNDMGILPPGDIRNCLVALANTYDLMENLMQYRFSDGYLKGQSFGNLFIAAMNGMSTDFEDAVTKMSQVLAITGKVLPVTLDDLRLEATLKDGTVIKGESSIGVSSREENPITEIKVKPDNVRATDKVLTEIANARGIILGPGSLYTSVMPNLLIPEVSKAINDSPGVKIYVCNIMTQPGETDGYLVSSHLKAILTLTEIKKIDYVIVNSTPLTDETSLNIFMKSGSKEVVLDSVEVEKLGVKIVQGDILSQTAKTIRHDPHKLAKIITDLTVETSTNKGSMTALEYLFAIEKSNIRDEVLRRRN